MSLKTWWDLTENSRPSMGDVADALGVAQGSAKKIVYGERRVSEQLATAAKLAALEQPQVAKEYIEAFSRGAPPDELADIKERAEKQKASTDLQAKRVAPVAELSVRQQRFENLFLSNPDLLENFALATNWGHEWKPDSQPTDPNRYEDEAMECLMLAIANPLIPSLVGKEKAEGYLEAVQFKHGRWRPTVEFVEDLFRIATSV